MIKSVNVIKDIGVFKNYNRKKSGIEHDFANVNFIYAGNTAGKSTLSDIFKSAGESSSDRIEERISIPNGENPQVVLGADGGTTSFKNGKWTNNSFKGNVMVFDTEFIQNNVFDSAGLIGERGTKENFTEFILGDEGVSQARIIEELKRKQREVNAKLQESVPASQKGKSNAQIKKYTNLEVKESEEDLKSNQKKIEERISIAKEIQKNANLIEEATFLEEIQLSAVHALFIGLTELNSILNKTYPVSIEEIVPEILKGKRGSEDVFSWIGQGVSIMGSDDTCPFCGRELNDDSCAIQYKRAFDSGYSEFRNDIIDALYNTGFDYNVLNVAVQLVSVIDAAKCINNLVGGSLASSIELLVSYQSKIVTLDQINQEKVNALQSVVEQTISAKKGSPATSMKCSLSVLKEVEQSYETIVQGINGYINVINSELKKAKLSIDNAVDISSDLHQLDNVNTKLERLVEQKQCSAWIDLKNEYDRLDKEIKNASDELKRDQSKYLERYFKRIDETFDFYGGNSFSIQRGDVSNRGYKKVIGVKIEFCNVPISDNQNSRKIFSESDVRALALAVFMAKVACLPDEERKNLILVFDDPVTSFDDNRVRNVIFSLEEWWQKVNQTFILSHNFTFSRMVYLLHSEDIHYFTIASLDDGNGIFDLNSDEIFCDEFTRLYNKIDNFIKKNTHELTTNDLRRFLEEYLKVVFIKPNKEKYAELSLGTRIDKLCEDGFCDGEVKEKLHRYRKMLNPESHRAVSGTEEELRNFSKGMLQYIFEHVRLEA